MASTSPKPIYVHPTQRFLGRSGRWLKHSTFLRMRKNGAPDWIRTSDLCLRRATLYPAELRVQRALMGSLSGVAFQHRLGSRGVAFYGLACLACQAFIWLISRSCAAMMSSASLRISGSLPCSSTTRAMATAPSWWGIMPAMKSLSASPV
jgi:hypothetical protein